MRQVLRRWEHLLNTPSAAITDELDPQIGPKSPSGRSNPEQKPQKPAYQKLTILIDALSHPDCRATEAREQLHQVARFPVRRVFREPLARDRLEGIRGGIEAHEFFLFARGA